HVDAAAVRGGGQSVRVVARAAVVPARPHLGSGRLVIGDGRVVGVVVGSDAGPVAAGGDVHPPAGGRQAGGDVPEVGRALVGPEPALGAGGGVVGDRHGPEDLNAGGRVEPELAVARHKSQGPV